MKKKPADWMLYFGRKFIGTPYVGSTLDRADRERLVVKVSGVDCTTFVEQAAALALCAQSGKFTFTVTDATGVAVGDYCFGTGLSTVGLGCKDAAIPKVTQVNGNTITVDIANTGTVSGIIRFTQVPSETVDPNVGFMMKLRITTVATATAAITHVRVETISSAAAQDNYYPLDMFTFELNGLENGSDVTILASGTETVLDNKEDIIGFNYFYNYETPQLVDITIYKQGYFPSYIRNYMLASANASLPVKQTADSTYIE